jgi:hypothetical protein
MKVRYLKELLALPWKEKENVEVATTSGISITEINEKKNIRITNGELSSSLINDVCKLNFSGLHNCNFYFNSK